MKFIRTIKLHAKLTLTVSWTITPSTISHSPPLSLLFSYSISIQLFLCEMYMCALDLCFYVQIIIAHYQIQLVHIGSNVNLYCHCTIQYWDHVPSSSLWVCLVVCLFVCLFFQVLQLHSLKTKWYHHFEGFYIMNKKAYLLDRKSTFPLASLGLIWLSSVLWWYNWKWVLGRYNAAKRLTRSDNLHFYDESEYKHFGISLWLKIPYGHKI